MIIVLKSKTKILNWSILLRMTVIHWCWTLIPLIYTHQYGVPINVFLLPMVLSNCALTPKSTVYIKS